MKLISLCIPTHNSSSFIIHSFEQVLQNEHINEIIINDDASEDFELLENNIRSLNSNKIKIFRNDINLKAYKNKMQTISYAKNDWVILLDSDNIINNDYVNTIVCLQNWDENIIYCPEKGLSNFNYSTFKEQPITTENILLLLDKFQFMTLLNTGNYFFNKHRYKNVFDKIIFDDHLSILDVLFFNIHWIFDNNTLVVIDGLTYIHTIRKDGFYNQNAHLGDGIVKKIYDKIKNNNFIWNNF